MKGREGGGVVFPGEGRAVILRKVPGKKKKNPILSQGREILPRESGGAVATAS